MNKNFEEWSKEKWDLDKNKIRAFFHEREVWFASLGVNIGFEQNRRGDKYLRPIIVLKKFNNEILWCIPLTKTQKKSAFYFSFELNKSISTAILSQIKLIDSKRLQYKIGDTKSDDFIKLKQKLKQLLV